MTLDGECSVRGYRVAKERSADSLLVERHPALFCWVLASNKAFEDTREFDALLQPAQKHTESVASSPGKSRLFPARNRPSLPRLVPETVQSFNPSPTAAPLKNAPSLPQWLHELLTFRRDPGTDVHTTQQDFCVTNPLKLRRSQDLLALTLLRAIYLIRARGEIKSKLVLSRQSPNNELKQLVGVATALALEAFEMLPPYIACLAPKDPATEQPVLTDPALSAVLPHSAFVSLRDQSKSHLRFLSVSAPPSNEPISGLTLVDPDLLLDIVTPSAPPHPPTLLGHSRAERTLLATSSVVPHQQLSSRPYDASHGPFAAYAMHLLPGSSSGSSSATNSANEVDHPSMTGVFCPPMGSTPYGLPFSRGFATRIPSGHPLDSASVMGARRSASSKTLFDGDRPLTPPAQGWYAKYSSGVTGVVWDRVHQAWVVSWTLAGKRTFRHFTCKSYGGFDKAREAAIEFRLARNRDIAAYNKRCKDRR